MNTRITSLLAVGLLLAACKQPPQSCVKMKALCETKLETCGELRDSVREQFGPEALDKFDACYIGAATCPEASGCVAGAAFKGAADAAKGFVEGLTKELEKKK